MKVAEGGERAEIGDTPEEELTDELVLRFWCFPGGCPHPVHSSSLIRHYSRHKNTKNNYHAQFHESQCLSLLILVLHIDKIPLSISKRHKSCIPMIADVAVGLLETLVNFEAPP